MPLYNLVCKIKKSFGKNGELAITLYDSDFHISPNDFLFVIIDDIYVPLRVLEIFRKSGQVVISFHDYETEAQVSFLHNQLLYTTQTVSSESNTEDIITFSSFIEYSFIDKKSQVKGIITHFYDYPNNPLWGAKSDAVEQEILIPCTPEFIIDIDCTQKILILSLPKGLIELNRSN